MRIGVLTTSYPRHDEDAAGVFVRGMARALAERGHRMEVLAPAPRERDAGPPRDPGIDVRWVRYAPATLQRTFYGAGVPDNVRSPRAWPGLASFPLALFAHARRRARGWDAVISHWALPSALVAGAVRGTARHLAVLHSADVHLLSRLPFRARWIDRLSASADTFLFASNALRRSLLGGLGPRSRGSLAERSHASAMGIDPLPPTRPRATLRDELGVDGFTVLSVGRLVPIKGIEHAVDAVDGIDGARLLVVGSGPERSALEGRAHNARFLGPRFGTTKAELLRAADAFVVPSVEMPSGRTEGTPVAALEAALAGCPIVASRTAGLAEVFEHGRSALLVPPGDSVALRSSLERLKNDEPLRLRLARNAQAVGRRYLWSELAPRIEAMLTRA